MKFKILIVQSIYNNEVTSKIFSKATHALRGKVKKLDVIDVPGAFEIPVAIAKNVKKYDGFVACGCIIKGKTPNFDFISRAITDAIMTISISVKKPIGNAILTCLDLVQAHQRIHKGSEAAQAVLDVLDNDIEDWFP